MVAQQSVNGNWLSQVGILIFDPLQNLHPLTKRQKIAQVIMSADPTAVQNLLKIRPWASRQRCTTIFVFILFLETHRSDRSIDFYVR